MRHKSASSIPEPIVQLQRELEQFEVAIRLGPGCLSRYGCLQWNWRGNTVCIGTHPLRLDYVH